MFRWTTHLKVEDRSFHDHAAVAVRHEIYCLGGPRDETQMGVHVFNTVSLRWRTLPPVATTGTEQCPVEVPSSRRGHTAVLIGDAVYVWGGSTSRVLHALDVDAHRWFTPQVSGAVPKGMSYHSACVSGKVMYVHGYDNTHSLDTAAMVWSLIEATAGTWSFRHSATMIGTKMFVFGGRLQGRGQAYTNNIRVFDTETKSWLIVSSKRPCWDHSAFAHNGEVYLIHDYVLTSPLRFNPETSSWKVQVEPKGKGPPGPGRSFVLSASCSTPRILCVKVGDRVVLFGGPKTPADDLYVLDLSPSMKTLCKLAVIQYGLEQPGLPHNIRWELAAMTGKEHV